MKKFKIYPFNSKFLEVFEEKKKKICEVMEDCDIHHIGSTAVFGLGGKGIIDIMIGINNWKESKEIVEKLKSIGFAHIHPKENERIFLSNKKESDIGDFHIHITKKGGNIYNDILVFRDYLKKNKKEVSNFYKLKIKWHTESNGDRKIYGKLKGEYIKKILGK